MAAPEELPDEIKRAIVTRLACYDTPSEVAKSVKEDFGIEISRQRVEAYDPNKVAGKALSQEFRDLFAEARKKFLEDTADIGIASKTYRLRMLDKMFTKANSTGNIGKAAELLEQAAKEVGGAFTNRRELSGPDGKPIQNENVPPADPKKQVLDELAAIFGAGGDAPAAEPAAEPAAAAAPAADTGAPAEQSPAGDRVLQADAGTGGGEVTGALAPGAALDDEE